MDKRTFIKSSSLLGIGSLTSFSVLGKMVEAVAHLPPEEVDQDEEFWAGIRSGYQLKPDYINLENGFYCIQPDAILDKYIGHIREINREGAHYMRTVMVDNKKAAAAKLAQLVGCPADELIITRNTTESLDMIISGFHWKEGDEAVMAEQDYGAMLEMFKQVSRRHGTVNRIVPLPLDPKSDDDIVDLYERAITPKTRLLMVCHIVNITGQILPVRKICDMAHRHGVQVMVDGAHAIAHLKFSIPELDCDYYGASLHKWLSVPLGAGMLYVKKENIGGIWPLFAEVDKKEDDISRLNHTGTHPPATDLTIADAIDFYTGIGAERKEARLRYLQNYWTNKVRGQAGILLNTPSDPRRSCGIANVGIKGMKPGEMAKVLLDEYKIYTVAIDTAGVHGCRVTPNVYTAQWELDKLVSALLEMKA